MPQAVAIPIGAAVAGAATNRLLGGGGQQQSSSNKYDLVDTSFYPLPFEQRDLLAQGQFDVTAGMLEQMLGDPYGFLSGSDFNFGGHAGAGHADASLIDMNDVAFQERPPEYLVEGLASRIGSRAGETAQSSARDINQAMALRGRDVNSPLALALKARSKRDAYENVNNSLSGFYDAFTQGALGRRAGGLATNAQLGTQTSISNAQMATQANIANAQIGAGAAQAAAAMGLQRAGLLLEFLNASIRPMGNLEVVGAGGTQTSSYQPGGADLVGSGLAFWRDLRNNTRSASGPAATPADFNFDWSGVNQDFGLDYNSGIDWNAA